VLLVCSSASIKVVAQHAFIDSIINPTSLKEVVKVLASDSLKGRFTGSDQAKQAAFYIAGEFHKAGVKPFAGTDSFFWHFSAPSRSALLPAVNVMATLKGSTRPDELIIFCAHYDHVGTRSTYPFPYLKDIPGLEIKRVSPRGDTIYNGANDNASGVAAVIHLARYFGQLRNNERTLVFIAFSGEELGLIGSQQVVSIFKPNDVMAVINIEMIGRTLSRRKRNPYITGSQYSDLKILLNTELYHSNDSLYKHNFFRDDPFPSSNLFARSDNYWFAMKGIPAHTIMSTSPEDRYYHSTKDEVSTLDFTLMTNLVKAIAVSTNVLIAGKATPSRINPRKVDAGF
jgi:Zn-dependent M28 family amino/carboxypeptidase